MQKYFTLTPVLAGRTFAKVPDGGTMRKIGLSKTAYVVFAFCVVAAMSASAETTFATLVNFDGTNGANPALMSLVQGKDGNFYGTTVYGGANDAGMLFRMTAGGMLSTLYSFCSQGNCTDGSNPNASLVQAANGNLYGTTVYGGTNDNCEYGCGTVFTLTPAGKLTVLHNFDGADGAYPAAEMIQATNGDFYGTTVYGGTGSCSGGSDGCGTVFRITAAGMLSTLYRFCSQENCRDGSTPYASLVQAADGNLYGTTWDGGANDNCQYGCGTVFTVTPAGKLTTLHSFDSTDGAYPVAGLVQATNGAFYGTTTSGGAGPGTVFKITAGGDLTTLHRFDVADGWNPYAGLVQATDRDFYGTTVNGGDSNNCHGGCGTVFKITAEGKLTTLHRFCLQTGCPDGYQPFGGLLQATNGSVYGTTCGGNDVYCKGASYGTVFGLSVGLGPFVKTLPASGKVRANVLILGNSLTGATGVSFHGTAAKFKVVSKSEIRTTVPSGATTGYVTVTTAKGTLKSNFVFRVRK
jgi:uncharacterized repeat protein (TIGR03803 family)